MRHEQAVDTRLRKRGYTVRWTFDLKTGETHEEQLDDTNIEFPMMNADAYLGKPYRYAYATLMPDDALINFSGIYEYDHKTSEKQVWALMLEISPEGRCVA